MTNKENSEDLKVTPVKTGEVAPEKVIEQVPEKEVEKVPEKEVPEKEVTEKEVEKTPETEIEQELPVFPAVSKVEASNTSKFYDESESLFKDYPDAIAFHFTSDGLAFFQHTDARNHASTLEDKEVISKVRQ